MAEKSTFGLDAKLAATVDWNLAVARISSDVRSDFILAPHLSCVYADSEQLLIDEVSGTALGWQI